MQSRWSSILIEGRRKKIIYFLKTQNLHTGWATNSLGKTRSCSSVIKMIIRLFSLSFQQCRDALIWNNFFYIACKNHHGNCKKTFYKWQNLLQAKSPICSLTPSRDKQTPEGDVIPEVESNYCYGYFLLPKIFHLWVFHFFSRFERYCFPGNFFQGLGKGHSFTSSR